MPCISVTTSFAVVNCERNHDLASLLFGDQDDRPRPGFVGKDLQAAAAQRGKALSRAFNPDAAAFALGLRSVPRCGARCP
jgi:hypothetical protein